MAARAPPLIRQTCALDEPRRAKRIKKTYNIVLLYVGAVGGRGHVVTFVTNALRQFTYALL